MADPGPSSAPTHAPTTGPAPAKSNPRARHQANLKKYGTPLPILLPTQPKRSTTSASSFSSYLPDFLLASTSKARAIEVPKCTGVYDAATRSVWVTDRRDAEILFRRGFFGKGTLSRSEPSWRERRMGLLKGGDREFSRSTQGALACPTQTVGSPQGLGRSNASPSCRAGPRETTSRAQTVQGRKSRSHARRSQNC